MSAQGYLSDLKEGRAGGPVHLEPREQVYPLWPARGAARFFDDRVAKDGRQLADAPAPIFVGSPGALHRQLEERSLVHFERPGLARGEDLGNCFIARLS